VTEKKCTHSLKVVCNNHSEEYWVFAKRCCPCTDQLVVVFFSISQKQNQNERERERSGKVNGRDSPAV